MDIVTICPACDEPLRIPERQLGARLTCRYCGALFLAQESRAPRSSRAPVRSPFALPQGPKRRDEDDEPAAAAAEPRSFPWLVAIIGVICVSAALGLFVGGLILAFRSDSSERARDDEPPSSSAPATSAPVSSKRNTDPGPKPPPEEKPWELPPGATLLKETASERTLSLRDLTLHEAKFSVRDTLPCLVWAPGDQAFFTLDSTGVVRRLAVPTFQEEARVDLATPCSWLSLSQNYVIVTAVNEVQLLDPRDLKVQARLPLPGVTRVVSCLNLAIGLATVGDDQLVVVDLQQQRALGQFSARTVGATFGWDNLVLTRDGQFLLTRGKLGELYRVRVNNGLLRLEQAGPAVSLAGPAVVVVSSDGMFVAAPCTGGNNRHLPNHPDCGEHATYIYRVLDLRVPVGFVTTGPTPRALTFDMAGGGLVYGQNAQNQLLVFSPTLVKLEEYCLGGGEVKQLLANLLGRKVLVLTGEKLVYAELPGK